MTLPSLFASHGGFGLNLNVFETNIVNLAIVIFGLYKFLPNFLGGILERRRAIILADLKDAEDRLATATSALAQAQTDLADAQLKAEQIRADGKARAEAIRLDSEKRTVEEWPVSSRVPLPISTLRPHASVPSCAAKLPASPLRKPWPACPASSVTTPRLSWSISPSKPWGMPDAPAQHHHHPLRRSLPAGG